jgi:chemotaxis-related protein WspD
MADSRSPLSESTEARVSLQTEPRSADVELSRCWAKIGVYGDGSCPELDKFIHCRNCPLYSTAAVELLNRALPADYRRESSQHFASEKAILKGATVSTVLFRLQMEWLALPTQTLQEVAERRLIHSLPHHRHGVVLGLANIRGDLVICVSLGHLLQIERAAPRESLHSTYHRLLALNWEGQRIAFPVDEVHGPHRFQPQETKTPPVIVGKSAPSCTQRLVYWEKRAVCLLDPALLFSALSRRFP